MGTHKRGNEDIDISLPSSPIDKSDLNNTSQLAKPDNKDLH